LRLRLSANGMLLTRGVFRRGGARAARIDVIEALRAE
jgi:hypothetical protein